MFIGAGMPAPEANQPVGPYVVDLRWHEQRVIVEYDSDHWHSSARARRRDAARHNDLTSWGWSVLHVTWPQLRDHPERILVWVAVKLSQSGWSPIG